MKLPAHIHVIGISGVATSAIAIAFHKQGVKITGSDKGFYPPVSTHLTEAGISYYAGWHPENIAAAGRPDFIMIGGSGTSPSNPEAVYAREQNIPIRPFAEVLSEYFIKKNSIVIAGTWGKTTISSLLSFMLIKAGLDPSYFSGGLSLSHDTGALGNSDWSVMEGDEYQISISDKRPKFACYAPTHLLLTSVSWDHADLYPTRQAYFDEFARLAERLPASGLLVSCADDAGVAEVLGSIRSTSSTDNTARRTSYGQAANADYRFHSLSPTREGLDFLIDHAGTSFSVHSPMLGRFNAENITACFAMACEIGIPPQAALDAIREFKGIRRRFEKRLDGDISVLDCHAPTPEKAASVLESLREVYAGSIIAVYEPNIGGRQRSSSRQYDGAFAKADAVIIPRLTRLKVDESQPDENRPLEGRELADIIAATHAATAYIEDDAALVAELAARARSGDVIVFLGSHGFRGMIEETVARFEKRA